MEPKRKTKLCTFQQGTNTESKPIRIHYHFQRILMSQCRQNCANQTVFFFFFFFFFLKDFVGSHFTSLHRKKRKTMPLVLLFHYLTSHFILWHMSRLVGKPTICIGENKDADQLRGNREADQRLCFRYSDSTIPLLLKAEISSF